MYPITTSWMLFLSWFRYFSGNGAKYRFSGSVFRSWWIGIFDLNFKFGAYLGPLACFSRIGHARRPRHIVYFLHASSRQLRRVTLIIVVTVKASLNYVIMTQKLENKLNLLKIYEEKLTPLGHRHLDPIRFARLTAGYVETGAVLFEILIFKKRQKWTCRHCYSPHCDSVAPRHACHARSACPLWCPLLW